MLSNIYDVMQIIKASKQSNLNETLEISEQLREISDYILNVINFIQLNRLALKQTLTNIDQEFSAFESNIFLEFFQEYYNQKNSHLKHFMEHPGTLRATFQLKYLEKIVEKGLNTTIKQESFVLPRSKVKKAPKNLNKKPNVVIDKRMMFSHKNEMDELSAFKAQPVMVDPMGFQTNDIEMQEFQGSYEETDVNSVLEKVKINLQKVRDVTEIQSHFFETHENNMFKFLKIKVNDYYEVPVLEERAFINYANQKLSKEEFIYVALKYDTKKEKAGVPVCYSGFDLFLVYLHTFLYIMNYYGMAQTSPDYSDALNLEKSFSGILQAATPGAALLFGFFINCITKTKYKCPYILCLFFLFCGNFMYFIADSLIVEDENLAIGILVAGRVLFGCGGSRLMTRKFIAINIPSQYQSGYSNLLVGLSALAITLGPGLSSCLEYIDNTTLEIDGLDFVFEIKKYNILALGFFGLWFLLFFVFLCCFKGYDVSVEKNLEKMQENERMLQKRFLSLNQYYKGLEDQSIYENLELVNKNQENFLVSGLVVNPVSNVSQQNYANPEGYKIVVPDNIKKGKTSKPSFRVTFPNGMTWYSLWCFFIFKIIQEAFITELPQMFDEYYGYNSQIVGWFLLSLTAVGVPTALLTGAATRKFEDRIILLFGFIVYILACIGKINFEIDADQPFVQYIIASSFLFMGSLITEAAAISILAKVISPSLKLGFFNAGLLAGSADTIGRAVGNVSMTAFSEIRFF